MNVWKCIMIRMIHVIAIFLSLLPLLLMRRILLMWGVINFLRLWIMIKNLCDTYIVELIHDPAKNYYERGTYAYRYFNNIKFPLFMLKVLKLHLFCLPMLISLCFNDLFLYKIPLHKKHVRLKFVFYLLLDALFCSSTLIPTRASLKSYAYLYR